MSFSGASKHYIKRYSQGSYVLTRTHNSLIKKGESVAARILERRHEEGESERVRPRNSRIRKRMSVNLHTLSGACMGYGYCNLIHT